ncbi:hypothetical protein LTS15_003888 [Exophiala xenobiotica]|nr:hypothetical protein LTS15_003888 [Exophiala xenobiotica]
MDEPPAKRAKRTDERTESQPDSSGRDAKPRSRYEGDRDQGRHHRRDDDHRKRSRSRDDHDKKRERSRSRERPRRDRDRDRERDRDRGAKDRNVNGDGHRDRSRSREKHRSSKGIQASLKDITSRSRDTDFRSERSHRRSRSRSPFRDGGSGSVRRRSPPRRSDHDRARPREPTKAEEGRTTPKAKPGPTDTGKPSVNGDSMAVDEDDEDALIRKMMGFTTFKTTQNQKIPGNQIYGVRKEKKTEYRQYMNRVGGFNRPLSPSR